MILQGDVRQQLALIPDSSVQACVTSPPYWGLRDYGTASQIGLEQTPDEYVEQMVAVFREVRRVLKDDGTLWLNLGDSYATVSGGMEQLRKLKGATPAYGAVNYADGYEGVKQDGKRAAQKLSGLKHKDLVGIPWRVAFALQADGWWLRQDIIWHKPNPMPESVTDRCTKAHEYLFLLTKSAKYWFDHKAIAEPAKTPPAKRDKHGEGYQADYPHGDRFSAGERVRGADSTRNRRSVWTVATRPFRGAHFAVMPEALVEPCILAATKQGDTVLDPFLGSGTVGVVAQRHGRRWIGCELNPEYAHIAETRIGTQTNLFTEADH